LRHFSSRPASAQSCRIDRRASRCAQRSASGRNLSTGAGRYRRAVGSAPARELHRSGRGASAPGNLLLSTCSSRARSASWPLPACDQFADMSQQFTGGGATGSREPSRSGASRERGGSSARKSRSPQQTTMPLATRHTSRPRRGSSGIKLRRPLIGGSAKDSDFEATDWYATLMSRVRRLDDHAGDTLDPRATALAPADAAPPAPQSQSQVAPGLPVSASGTSDSPGFSAEADSPILLSPISGRQQRGGWLQDGGGNGGGSALLTFGGGGSAAAPQAAQGKRPSSTEVAHELGDSTAGMGLLSDLPSREVRRVKYF